MSQIHNIGLYLSELVASSYLSHNPRQSHRRTIVTRNVNDIETKLRSWQIFDIEAKRTLLIPEL